MLALPDLVEEFFLGMQVHGAIDPQGARDVWMVEPGHEEPSVFPLQGSQVDLGPDQEGVLHGNPPALGVSTPIPSAATRELRWDR